MNGKNGTVDDFKAEIDASKQHEVDSAMAQLKAETDRHKRNYDGLLEEYNAFKGQSGWLDSLKDQYTPGGIIEAKTKTGTGEGAVIAVASDWHVFETVKPERVNGLNEYNPKIAEKSIAEYFNGILAWTEIHRTKLKIKTLFAIFKRMILCADPPSEMLATICLNAIA